MSEHLPPSRVDRAWLARMLDTTPTDDEARLVDILHVRYATPQPASRALLGRTLGVSAQTVGKREREGMARLRAHSLEELEAGEGLRPGTRLHAAVLADAEPDEDDEGPAAAPMPQVAESPPAAAAVELEPTADELAAAATADTEAAVEADTEAPSPTPRRRR
jgi:hypothetical protein